ELLEAEITVQRGIVAFVLEVERLLAEFRISFEDDAGRVETDQFERTGTDRTAAELGAVVLDGLARNDRGLSHRERERELRERTDEPDLQRVRVERRQARHGLVVVAAGRGP